MISDTATELPIWETTKKANVSEIRIARAINRSHIKYLSQTLHICDKLSSATLKEMEANAEIDDKSKLRTVITSDLAIEFNLFKD
ncbi:hypothetical protein JW960_11925 [candidate division KSB1 bacterium]|nr:hypothetical protein [candidate division KSB1 bacterium]